RGCTGLGRRGAVSPDERRRRPAVQHDVPEPLLRGGALMRAARFLSLRIVALAAVAAAGCNEVHYWGIDVTFNKDTASSGFAAGEVERIQVCVMRVSGADSASLRIGPNMNGLPMAPGFAHLGIVEFSTFADSGQLTFTMDCYDDVATVDPCKVGSGT